MADRFSFCLAPTLREETGYEQPMGGPYVRLVVTASANAKRRKRGEQEWPLGAYVLDEHSGMLRHRDGSLHDIPDKPDGMAFDDDPRDPGGRTGMGILQRELNAYCKLCSVDVHDVWGITDRELTWIYHEQFWDAVQCDKLPVGVDRLMFDIATNQGVGAAVKLLQSALGAKIDGHLGTATLAAVYSLDATKIIRAVTEARKVRYRKTRNFATFGENWITRADRVCALSIKDAKGAEAAQAPVPMAPPGNDPGVEPVLEQEALVPPPRATADQKTATSSTTLWAAGATKIAGVSALVATASDTADQAHTIGETVSRMLSNPTTLSLLLVIGLAAVIFRERLKKILMEGA